MLHGSATSPVADTLQPPTGGEFRRANPLSPRWVRTPWAPARSDQPLVTTLGPTQEGFVAWASVAGSAGEVVPSAFSRPLLDISVGPKLCGQI
jgi:hypothetical protein